MSSLTVEPVERYQLDNYFNLFLDNKICDFKKINIKDVISYYKLILQTSFSNNKSYESMAFVKDEEDNELATEIKIPLSVLGLDNDFYTLWINTSFADFYLQKYGLPTQECPVVELYNNADLSAVDMILAKRLSNEHFSIMCLEYPLTGIIYPITDIEYLYGVRQYTFRQEIAVDVIPFRLLFNCLQDPLSTFLVKMHNNLNLYIAYENDQVTEEELENLLYDL